MADNKFQIKIIANDEASGAFDKIQRKMTDLNNQVDKTSRRFTEINSAITNMAGAISLIGVAMLTKDMADAGLQLEKLNKLFNAATGSASLGGREFEYIRNLSEKMGLSFVDTAQSYGKFTAAMRGTSMEGEQGRKVFEAVSGATTALGLSADETGGVFNALQQMISKSKVQAEELRGQLGERLPGAFKMAADAMGVSTAELDKMLQKGEVVASDLLPKLAEQLNKTYGVAATEGAKSAAAELNRMNNAMFDAKAAAGAALIPALTDIAKAMVPIVQKVQEFIGGVQILSVKAAGLWDRFSHTSTGDTLEEKFKNMANYKAMSKATEESVISDIMKKYTLQGSDYTAAEKATQALRSKMQAGTQAGAATESASKKAAAALEKERKEAEKLQQKLSEIRSLETGALQAGSSFSAATFGGGNFLQVDSSRYGSGMTGSLSLSKNDKQGGIDASRYSLMGSGSGLDPSRWDPSADELKKAEEQKAELLQIEERYNQQMLSSKMQFAEQSLALLAESSAEGSAIQIAAMVAMKALAIAQIIMNAHAASSAALLPPPVGLGPIAGQGMAASILAMGYANAAITGAVGIMSIANSVTGKRESGGPVVAGQSYLVGEKRPEIFTPNQSGWITPRADGGGGGVTQNITIDARGADAGVLARIDAAMKKAREDAKTDIMNSLNRGGAYSRAVGRA